MFSSRRRRGSKAGPFGRSLHSSRVLKGSGGRMPSFIKPLSKHWRPADFVLTGAVLREPVQHIAKTVCLLESRCDDYAGYLRAMFLDRDDRWNAAVDQWNSEECQHGELLRLLCRAADADFRFEAHMARYATLVSYHAPTGQSVRGSAGAELVARCVVEALASTLYRVLEDASERHNTRQVFSVLARDEARHFGMFLKMLNAEAVSRGGLGRLARFGHAVRRMIDLEDGQIMVASCIVAGRGDAPIDLHREANSYLVRLYGLYRWRHLRYAVRMLLQTVGVRPSRPLTALGTSILWAGIRLRWVWARAFGRRRPSRPARSAAQRNSKQVKDIGNAFHSFHETNEV